MFFRYTHCTKQTGQKTILCDIFPDFQQAGKRMVLHGSRRMREGKKTHLLFASPDHSRDKHGSKGTTEEEEPVIGRKAFCACN